MVARIIKGAAGLIQKAVTDKNGVTRQMWVKGGEAASKGAAAKGGASKALDFGKPLSQQPASVKNLMRDVAKAGTSKAPSRRAQKTTQDYMAVNGKAPPKGMSVPQMKHLTPRGRDNQVLTMEHIANALIGLPVNGLSGAARVGKRVR